MTTSQINIKELTSRLTFLKRWEQFGSIGEVLVDKKADAEISSSNNDEYAAYLYINGRFCQEISSMPKEVDASDLVYQIMKMKKKQ